MGRRDPVYWAQDLGNFRLEDTGEPIQFARHQAAVLRYCLGRRENGRLPFRLVLWSECKKAGKTTVSGAVIKWAAETWGQYGEILCVGNDADQAQERGFRKMTIAVEQTPGYLQDRQRLPGVWQLHGVKRAVCTATGTVVKAVAKDYRGEAGGNPILSVWCVSAETEILTQAGWKMLPDLDMADAVATLNIETGMMEWQRPKAINLTPYKGPMIRFKHRRAEFLVTPNHRVLGHYSTHSRYTKAVRSGPLQYRSAAELAEDKVAAGWLKADAGWEGTPIKASLAECALWGFYISEGCIHWSSRAGQPYASAFYIGQSQTAHPGVYDQIRDALDSLSLRYTSSEEGFYVIEPEWAARLVAQGKSWDRYVPRWLKDAPRPKLEAFFDAYLLGDGWAAGKDGHQCCTTSPQLADDLMEVGMKLGYTPRLMNVRQRAATHRPIYRVSFSRHAVAWERYKGHWSYEDYDGLVGCPSTPNGNFYMRYRGNACWTGNTELWGFIHKDDLRFWSEMAPSPTRPDSIRMVETYAGWEGESELLWGLYEQIVLEGRQLTAGELGDTSAFAEAPNPDSPVPCWVNEAAGMFAYWDSGPQAHRQPWQQGPEGAAYYANEAASQTPANYTRLHLNEWASAESSFIDLTWWDGCQGDPIPLLPGDDTPLVLAMDAAVTGDTFAVVVVSRDPDRPGGFEQQGGVMLRSANLWVPVGGKPLDFGLVETMVRTFCANHNVVQIAYDPYQLHDMATRLQQDTVAWCRPFGQGQERLIADGQLYQMIVQRRIRHDGAWPEVREHLSNANKKVSASEDTRLRIVKKSEGRKIDAVVALSMATAECLRLTL